jgi:Protein of unknown function (DUF5131)
MTGSLHKKRQMDLQWALELYQRCQAAGVPFLFKQASDLYTERGIDGLSRYIRHLGGVVSPGPGPLIREYPITDPPLLPFTERGHRYTDSQWAIQIKNATGPNESEVEQSNLIRISPIATSG